MKTSLVATWCVALLCAGPTPSMASGQERRPTAEPWTAARTAWGAPDLQGIWDYRTLTPLERPDQFDGREFLSSEEIAGLERERQDRADGRPADRPLGPRAVLARLRHEGGQQRTQFPHRGPAGRESTPTVRRGSPAGERAAGGETRPRGDRFIRDPQCLGAVHHTRAPPGDAPSRV